MLQQLQQLQQQLQQQQQDMVQLRGENQRLQREGLGALPQLVQVLQAQSKERSFVSLVDVKGLGKPSGFNGKEESWREWSLKFASFVAGAFGEDFRKVLTWAAESPQEIAETDWVREFGTGADPLDQVEE
eukprot:5799547-Amphidinium_carterae.2